VQNAFPVKLGKREMIVASSLLGIFKLVFTHIPNAPPRISLFMFLTAYTWPRSVLKRLLCDEETGGEDQSTRTQNIRKVNNAIHSRRKRDRRRQEFEILKQESERLTRQHSTLKEEKAVLENLLKGAQDLADAEASASEATVTQTFDDTDMTTGKHPTNGRDAEIKTACEVAAHSQKSTKTSDATQGSLVSSCLGTEDRGTGTFFSHQHGFLIEPASSLECQKNLQTCLDNNARDHESHGGTADTTVEGVNERVMTQPLDAEQALYGKKSRHARGENQEPNLDSKRPADTEYSLRSLVMRPATGDSRCPEPPMTEHDRLHPLNVLGEHSFQAFPQDFPSLMQQSASYPDPFREEADSSSAVRYSYPSWQAPHHHGSELGPLGMSSNHDGSSQSAGIGAGSDFPRTRANVDGHDGSAFDYTPSIDSKNPNSAGGSDASRLSKLKAGILQSNLEDQQRLLSLLMRATQDPPRHQGHGTGH